MSDLAPHEVGDWRTVWIVGTVAEEDIPTLQSMIRPRFAAGVHALAYPGPRPGGLNLWVSQTMDVVGDVARPDCTVDSIANSLLTLSLVAPSLRLKVHCGGTFRDRQVVATITVSEDVVIGAPEVDELRPLGETERIERVVDALLS